MAYTSHQYVAKIVQYLANPAAYLGLEPMIEDLPKSSDIIRQYQHALEILASEVIPCYENLRSRTSAYNKYWVKAIELHEQCNARLADQYLALAHSSALPAKKIFLNLARHCYNEIVRDAISRSIIAPMNLRLDVLSVSAQILAICKGEEKKAEAQSLLEYVNSKETAYSLNLHNNDSDQEQLATYQALLVIYRQLAITAITAVQEEKGLRDEPIKETHKAPRQRKRPRDEHGEDTREISRPEKRSRNEQGRTTQYAATLFKQKSEDTLEFTPQRKRPRGERGEDTFEASRQRKKPRAGQDRATQYTATFSTDTPFIHLHPSGAADAESTHSPTLSFRKE